MTYHVIGAKVVSDGEQSEAHLCHLQAENRAALVNCLALAWRAGYGGDDGERFAVIEGEPLDISSLDADVCDAVSRLAEVERALSAAEREGHDRREYERLKAKFSP